MHSLYVQVFMKWFAGSSLATQWITSTKPLLNTRRDFLPTVKIQKRNNSKTETFFSGESWLGLENLHRLTSQQSYSLQITMTDWDQQTYVAVYHQFEVRQSNQCIAMLSNSLLLFTAA